MTNFTTPQGSTPKDGGAGKPAGQGGYKSKLEEILAKAGNNNPIAAAQAKNQGKPAQPAASVPATAAPAPAAQPVPAAPVAPTAPAVPGQPQNPGDRLQQILAMAGQTPAQRAQAQAQQNLANNAAGILAMLQGYLQAVSQDPRKVLACDIEFSANPGANADMYFKCYADQAGNLYWDVFGDDISYVVPSRIASYQLYDDYYKGVTDADFQADMAAATVHSHRIA